tara:strand:- start:394 stop:864 length:471 start_codon:yes stop_codon:yes gene_type:complete
MYKTRQNKTQQNKTQQNKTRQNKTQQNKKHKNITHKNISKYFIKRDICCEDDIKREKCINIIFENYKIIAKNTLNDESQYLDFIDNHLPIFVGYLSNLEKNKNKEAIKLWKYISSQSQYNGETNFEKIENFLYHVPLFYLMSLLGYSTYKKDIIIN